VYPATNAGWGVEVAPLSDLIEGSARRPLLVLFGAAGFVLLIACVNVANLSLARVTRRQRELGIRAALGAGQLRLTRLLLAESALLAFAGSLCGLAVAVWGTELLSRIGAGHLPAWTVVRMDYRVLAFATAVSVMTALLCGIVPARRAARPDLHAAMEPGTASRRIAGGRLRLRQVLVIGEIAMSFVLLVGAGLLLRSFAKLVQVDPGFRPEQLLAVTIFLPERKYSQSDRQAAFFGALLERVRILPGVVSASAVTTLPLNPVGIDYDLPFSVEGDAPKSPGEATRLDFRLASPDYFRTLGVPLIRGRDFRDDDRKGAPPVTIVNQTLAHRFFGATDPVGRRVRIGGGIGSSEIVGVVADVRHDGLDTSPAPEMYVPYPQYPHGGMTLLLRVRGDPLLLAAPVKGEVRELDPTLAVSQVATLPEILASSVSGERFNVLLLGSLAVLALGLACLGIYGVLAYLVNLQSREIGLRLALGARPRQVLSGVLRQGLGLTAAGVIAGIGGALVVTRVLAGLLYEVKPEDPATFAGITLLLFSVATLACAVPARRAARVDPMVALRSE
jgi:putative ABC transport system permease protein